MLRKADSTSFDEQARLVSLGPHNHRVIAVVITNSRLRDPGTQVAVWQSVAESILVDVFELLMMSSDEL